MRVHRVHRDDRHRFSKSPAGEIELIEGFGVEGDAHAGATVQHLHLQRRNRTAPNLRQVHLIPLEMLDELAVNGYDVAPGELGENIVTAGLDLFELPVGTTLHLGDTAILTVTGLRDPCSQINKLRKGLLKQVLTKTEDGSIVRRAGIMSVVTVGGTVRPGDQLTITLPPAPHEPLDLV
ncbi:MOSC domain-containing protein [Kribbella sp. CA-293567]|uniref:MOSC domain-containing protein n=1 Tax=Kribbella sp. CA-293567 TaxID=3002436 RepID=UPI0022DDC549|nr:MOSC domain-containing protein [Kribbella sp. CA-293567]WBQ03960.1 MOSC domain-containing protein [Kribbella sp. CA-293567]